MFEDTGPAGLPRYCSWYQPQIKLHDVRDLRISLRNQYLVLLDSGERVHIHTQGRLHVLNLCRLSGHDIRLSCRTIAVVLHTLARCV